jgi:hypothetical protein
MEEENHSLLQVEATEQEKQPQLLMISSHAANGTSSAATFSLIISFRGRRGIALVDNGSTGSFLDYTFASKCNCNILSAATHKVRVTGGGYLESNATTSPTPYFIQNEDFSNSFKLLQLKGYDLILGCD